MASQPQNACTDAVMHAQSGDMNNSEKSKLTTVHTHTFNGPCPRDYPGEPVPVR